MAVPDESLCEVIDTGRVSPETAVQMAAELIRLRRLISKAREFAFAGGIVISMRGQDRWAVQRGSFVLNTDGEFEYEPLPSERDESFIGRTRFSLEEAMERADAALLAEKNSTR